MLRYERGETGAQIPSASQSGSGSDTGDSSQVEKGRTADLRRKPNYLKQTSLSPVPAVPRKGPRKDSERGW